jgi:hypothetical protein
VEVGFASVKVKVKGQRSKGKRQPQIAVVHAVELIGGFFY